VKNFGLVGLRCLVAGVGFTPKILPVMLARYCAEYDGSIATATVAKLSSEKICVLGTPAQESSGTKIDLLCRTPNVNLL